MSSVERADREAGGTRLTAAYLLISYAALWVLSHPFAPAWCDENYTLINFVAGGPRAVFGDYHVANNHVFYSFGLWAWQRIAGEGLLGGRLFSLILASLALPGLYVAGKALGDRRIGILAALIFGLSHIVGDFSAQLRGYGLSLGLTGLSLGFAAMWQRSACTDPKPALAYALSGALAVATIPTNIFFILSLGFWALFSCPGWSVQQGNKRAFFWVLAPLTGFCAYLGVWPQFQQVAGMPAPYVYGDFLAQTLTEMLVYDLPWVAPLLVLGAWAVRGPASRSYRLLLAVVCLAFVWPLLTKVPFTRNFIPLIVPLSLLAGWALAAGLERYRPWRPQMWMAAAAAVLCVLAAGREALLRETQAQRWLQADGKPQGLIEQYYHSARYHPQEIESYLAKIERPLLVTATDDVIWDIPVLWTLPERIPVVTCKVLSGRPGCSMRVHPSRQGVRIDTVWVIARGERQARLSVDTAFGDGRVYRLQSILDSGNYFKVWAVTD